MTRIVGERIALRKVEPDDAEAIHSYLSDPEVIRYMTFEERSREHTQQYVDSAIAKREESPRSIYILAVTLPATGELIGTCNISVKSAEDRRAAIGWMLHPEHWGQGYGSEVARLLIAFGWETLRLHRIEALCDPANHASARIMEKAGMVREGHLRDYLLIRGEWCDCLIYSILAE